MPTDKVLNRLWRIRFRKLDFHFKYTILFDTDSPSTLARTRYTPEPRGASGCHVNSALIRPSDTFSQREKEFPPSPSGRGIEGEGNCATRRPLISNIYVRETTRVAPRGNHFKYTGRAGGRAAAKVLNRLRRIRFHKLLFFISNTQFSLIRIHRQPSPGRDRRPNRWWRRVSM